MRVLTRIPVTDAMLTSNVSITETAWTAGAYVAGDRRYVSNFDLYEALSSTSDEPTAGAKKDPPTWGLVGKINKFAMFDGKMASKTTNAASVDVTVDVTAAAPIGGVSVLRAQGSTVQVIVTVAGVVVYDQTKPIVDTSGIYDWYTYWFSEVKTFSTVDFLDIPPYWEASIQVIVNSNSDASLSELVIGQLYEIGLTKEGSQIELVSYSSVDTDVFGETTFVPRDFVYNIKYDIQVDSEKLEGVMNLLSGMRDKFAVFYGVEEQTHLTLFGFIKAMNATSETTKSPLQLEIQGAI